MDTRMCISGILRGRSEFFYVVFMVFRLLYMPFGVRGNGFSSIVGTRAKEEKGV